VLASGIGRADESKLNMLPPSPGGGGIVVASPPELLASWPASGGDGVKALCDSEPDPQCKASSERTGKRSRQ
jgi:hypothetical protein